MKARDVISPRSTLVADTPRVTIDANMPLVDLLPRLLDSPDRIVGVRDDDNYLGIIDESSLLEGLNSFIAPRDDASLITVITSPTSYSASALARAVEDAETHLVDLWTTPYAEGQIKVTLRVRTTDPSAVVGSLERYGYSVSDASGSDYSNATIAIERLMSLKALLDV